MNNPKAELVEKERICYINGDTAMATFLGEILDHVISLEEVIGKQDKKQEEMESAVKKIWE